MTIQEIKNKIKSGDKIRRASWEQTDYMIVYNVFDYCGTDFGFSPECYSPSGMLYHKDGRTTFWIYPNNKGTDWEII